MTQVEVEARLAQARCLSSLLIDVAELAKGEFAQAMEPFGLPVPLARALLLMTEPAPMRDLAGQLSCDRSYVTGLADQLERRGLVARVPGADRRIKLLQLTEEGRALREKISVAAVSGALVLRRLDDEQRATLLTLLEALLADAPEQLGASCADGVDAAADHHSPGDLPSAHDLEDVR